MIVDGSPFRTRRTYKEGDCILEMGKVSDEAFRILSGEVLVSLPLAKGIVRPLAIRKAGAFIGEMSLIRTKRCAANVSACSPVVEVEVIKRSEFRAMCERSDPGIVMMLRQLAERLSESDRLGLLVAQWPH